MIRKLKILIDHKIRAMARETDPRVREGMRLRLVRLQNALDIARENRAVSIGQRSNRALVCDHRTIGGAA